jgi:hypothetical protein
MKRAWILLIFVCGFSGIAMSQGNWKLYSTGSENIGISSVAVDGDYIWAGVSGTGVFKLNRKSETYILYTEKDGLLNNYVISIAVDNNKVKWFGHLWSKVANDRGKNGISSFDDTKWNQYTQLTVPVIAEYDSLHYYHWRVSIDDIAIVSGNMILFSASGQYSRADGGGVRYISNLLVYDNNIWKIKTNPGNAGFPLHLAVDTANPDTVWFVESGPGVGYFVKPNYNYENDNRFILIGGRAICMDKTNTVWYAGYSDINKFNRRSFTYFPPDSTGILANICAIAIDKNNVKWFGSSMGITRYDGNTWKTFAPEGWYYHYDPAFSGYSDQVTALTFDADGFLWVGTNKGLYRFEESPVSVRDVTPKPVFVSIDGVSPNPFNASTSITFSLPKPGMAVLTVYSLAGQKVRTLVSERMNAGKHTAIWDGRDERGGAVSSGIFITTLQSGGEMDSRKMLLLK